jgi:hypothetical protein
MELITAGGLSSFLLELFKWLVRLWKPDFDFPAKFYVVALPVLNFAVLPLLALLSVEGYELPVDWQSWVLELIKVLLASLISLSTYTVAISPLKDHADRNEV